VCFSRQDLSTHNSTTHKQDPRPYRCDQCGRQFSTCAYLSQHRRIHSGIKPYVCRYCDRKFTQLSHVQQHERIHTGEKPYKSEVFFTERQRCSNLEAPVAETDKLERREGERLKIGWLSCMILDQQRTYTQ
ncbi:unnamed protein product, partial [Hymenolepis diminuta]|uniref:Zinc finger protein n=1 Tax=Hymenolepis diminuta TaxID=6216 RepID=A0A0R3SNL0_HYMDI